MWQPIETAPKDGTEILLYDKYKDINKASWIDNWCGSDARYQMQWCIYGSMDSDDRYRTVDCPTHWMPLPEEPDAKKNTKKEN